MVATKDYYPLSDTLYRTAAVTDAFGRIVRTYDYDAYGKTTIFGGTGPDGVWFTDDDVQTDRPGCRYLYTGREYDAETGLYYYRARMYHPGLGRFLQRDPIEYQDGMGLYEYVRSIPNKFIDPSGKKKANFSWCEWNIAQELFYSHNVPY